MGRCEGTKNRSLTGQQAFAGTMVMRNTAGKLAATK